MPRGDGGGPTASSSAANVTIGLSVVVDGAAAGGDLKPSDPTNATRTSFYSPGGGLASAENAVSGTPPPPDGSTAERSFSAPLPGTSLVAHLSLLPTSVRLAFACRDTADIYSREVPEAEVSSIQPALASLGALYNFLEESLKVASLADDGNHSVGSSAADTTAIARPADSSLSCSVRFTRGSDGLGKPEVVFKSLLRLTVDMNFPRTHADEKQDSLQLRKQPAWCAEEANLRRAFSEALVAQEARFEERLAAQVEEFEARLAAQENKFAARFDAAVAEATKRIASSTADPSLGCLAQN